MISGTPARLTFALAILALAATGVASAQLVAGGAGRQRGIAEQNNSGQAGFVTLYPKGAKTLVKIVLLGEPAGRVEPAHIHLGACPKIDQVPTYPLAPVVNGHSTTLVPAAISALVSGKYSVNVHASAQNLKHYVACGYLTPGT